MLSVLTSFSSRCTSFEFDTMAASMLRAAMSFTITATCKGKVHVNAIHTKGKCYIAAYWCVMYG